MGHEIVQVPVVPLSETRRDEAEALSKRWGLPYEVESAARFQLQLTQSRLQLIDSEEAGQGAVFVDFVAGAAAHRRRFGGGRGQAIAKAVGLKGGASPTVLDATGGLGRDAFVLASLGCRVILLERSPVVAALLQDGLERAALDAEIGGWVRQRMALCHADALRYMAALEPEDFPDVVYLDPMFPHRRKSAQVKKEMRLLQQLLGGDEDADSLLTAALRVATKRVVVKRPDYAPCLAGMAPTMALKSKKHRYDVYIQAAMGENTAGE